MLNLIREIQPRYVVGENVRGLTNWNDGVVFDEVQANLEAEGYEVLPFLLPAAGVNAPHQRYRIWFIAYANHAGANHRSGVDPSRQTADEGWEIESQPEFGALGGDGIAADPACQRAGGLRDAGGPQGPRGGDELPGELRGLPREWSAADPRLLGSTWPEQQATGTEQCDQRNAADPGGAESQRRTEFGSTGGGWAQSNKHATRFFRPTWEIFPTQSPLCNGDDGLSARLVGITFPRFRNESIKAGGNAIVPQIAWQIFKAIQAMEDLRLQQESDEDNLIADEDNKSNDQHNNLSDEQI